MVSGLSYPYLNKNQQAEILVAAKIQFNVTIQQCSSITIKKIRVLRIRILLNWYIVKLIFYLIFVQLNYSFTLASKEKEFAQLIKDNQGLIIKVSRLYTNSLEDEEDLFQEIVLQLWRSYDSFKGNSKISTWMYRVALNTAITLFRKKSKSLPTNELDINHADFIDDDDEKQQQVSLLYTVIKTLPNVERAIVMMYLDDLPYKDIAENLGITEVNARVKMNRLKKTLKEQMEKHA